MQVQQQLVAMISMTTTIKQQIIFSAIFGTLSSEGAVFYRISVWGNKVL